MPHNPAPLVPRLFLITPPLSDSGVFAPLLEAAMGVADADIACVLVRIASRDDGSAKSIVKALAPLVQASGAALLLAFDHRIVARVDADGVQLAASDPALSEALASLQPRKIVGVRAIGRDEAMSAGEAGVDYVMFGGPDSGIDVETVRERAAWWAEIFNVPCVAYADHPLHVGEMARTGAEFVGICEGLWDDPARVADILREVSQVLADVGMLAEMAR